MRSDSILEGRSLNLRWQRFLSALLTIAMLFTMMSGTTFPVKAASYELLNPISGSVQGVGYDESAGHDGIDLYPYNYGDPVYAVASGTIMYSCPRNHTKIYQTGDDCCTVKIILDEPITYNGMTYVCAFYTHMSSLVYDIYCGYKPECVSEYKAGLRQGALQTESVHVEAGDLIGYVGKGNAATHLHLSFETSEADGYKMMPNSGYYDVFGWNYNEKITAKESNVSNNNTPSQDKETNSNFPYPSLLDYSDLDSSFNQLARNKISSAYQDYILKAIKYHIESSDGDYRVAKNLLQKYDTVDGNVIFFFDGCSVNLDGATPTFSGYLKDGKRYNTSAVCIAIRANAQGRSYVAFASANASTMADNVRKASLNSGTPVPITIDGIYNISAVNHQSKYAAMNINTLTNSAVRCTTNGVSYIDKGNGINIHSKGYSSAYLTDSTYSSTGCFNVGRTTGDAEYNEFILQTTGMSNAYNGKFSSTPTSFGISNGSMVGIVIVDRSNYISQLETIYGDDAVSGGWSKQKIASEITKNSVQWHADIDNILPPADTHSCVYSITEVEALHPHKVYVKCECGQFGGYTAPSSYLSSCSDCNEVCHCSSSYSGTYTCITSTYPLTIRSGHGTDYDSKGSIPSGATVTVSKANGSWAHVTYNGVSGYASMKYLAKVESTVDGYPLPFKTVPLATGETAARALYSDGTARGWIYGSDECTIKEIYSSGLCLLNCEYNGTYQDLYAYTSDFLCSTTTPTQKVVESYATTYYRSTGSDNRGWVDAGDKVYILGNSGARTQIIYPHTDGTHRCAWVDTSSLTHTHTPGPAATCTTPQTCITCDAILAETTSHIPGPSATCTANQTCTVCGIILNQQTAHSPGTAATCTTPQVCTECGVILAGLLEHSYTAGDYIDPIHPHRIFNTCGCGAMLDSGSTSKVANCIECYPPPIVSGITHSPSTVKVGETVTFTLNSTGGTEYCISIGDGNKQIHQSLTNSCEYTFQSAGTYYINGWAKNDNGTTYSETTTLIVEETVTSYKAYVYTEAKKTAVQGSQFTYTVSLAGSYDGFSFEIASGNGLTVTNITTKNSNINIDEIGDKWMISVLGGFAMNNAEKEDLVTVTVQVESDAELGARTLTLSNLKLSNESGDKISAIKYEYATIEITDQIPGDINGDGTFDYYDVSKLYAYYRNKTTLSESIDKDINGDGGFDYYDVSKLYAIYRGKATFLIDNHF